MQRFPMDHRALLKSRHPIVAVPMNRVSDVGLAVAVHRAGAFPSISSFNFYRDDALDLVRFETALQEFRDRTGSTDVLLSVSWNDFRTTRLVELLLRLDFRFIELFYRVFDAEQWAACDLLIRQLRKRYGFKPILKVQRATEAMSRPFSAVIVKGGEGAGRTLSDAGSLREQFAALRQASPDLPVVPSGGIATAAQLRDYMDAGALAVGIGTLFAVSEESCIARETKLKMVEATTADLRKFGPLRHQGLVFSAVEKDDENNTGALSLGIASPERGSVFVGSGIDHVTEILPVREIVARLVS